MTTSVWTKIVAGSPERRTRLHDLDGETVPLSRLLRNGPRAVLTGLGRILFGTRPARPWISYDGQRAIAARLRPDARVLEYGSGMSTIWYARRAAEIVSVDCYPDWYRSVAALLARRNIGNVRLRLATDAASYVLPTADEIGPGFDLIVIDGSHRERCAEVALGLLRPGGMIYLDNADRSLVDRGSGDGDAARRTLLSHAARSGWTTRWFVDFAPTQFFVQKGLLVTDATG